MPALALVMTLLLALGAGVLWSIFGPRAYLWRKTRETVVVHLKSGTSLHGILAGVYVDVIVLAHAEVAPIDAKEMVSVDGEQIVLRADVDWIQALDSEVAW